MNGYILIVAILFSILFIKYATIKSAQRAQQDHLIDLIRMKWEMHKPEELKKDEQLQPPTDRNRIQANDSLPDHNDQDL